MIEILLSEVGIDSSSTSSLCEVSDRPREFDEGGMNFFTACVFNTTGGEAIVTAGAFPKHSPDKNWLRGIVRSNSTSFEAKNKFLPSQRGRVTFPLDKLAGSKLEKNKHIGLDFLHLTIRVIKQSLRSCIHSENAVSIPGLMFSILWIPPIRMAIE
jgi:hypothetical protein